jgi:hypothetical protein
VASRTRKRVADATETIGSRQRRRKAGETEEVKKTTKTDDARVLRAIVYRPRRPTTRSR